MRDDERVFAALAHLSVICPLWGVIGAAVIWIYFKEKSREVVFHAQQAIFFQICALALFLIWIVASLFEGIVRVISDTLAGWIHSANLFFLLLGFVIYAGICAYGAYRTYSTGQFLYPMLGRRMAEGYRRQSVD